MSFLLFAAYFYGVVLLTVDSLVLFLETYIPDPIYKGTHFNSNGTYSRLIMMKIMSEFLFLSNSRAILRKSFKVVREVSRNFIFP